MINKFLDFGKAIKKFVHDKQNPDSEFTAMLGSPSGNVKVPGSEKLEVYITDQSSGQILTVINRKIPNRRGRFVVVGYDKGSTILEVLRYDDDQNSATDIFPMLPDHSHTYGVQNPAWVDTSQILSFLVMPLFDLAVRVYPANVAKTDGTGWVRVEEDAELDLSASQPTTGQGVRYVLIQADNDGTISTIDGSLVADRDTLAVTDIPTATGVRSHAVILSEFEGTLSRTEARNDFVDLRFDGGSKNITSLPFAGLGDLNDVLIDSPADDELLAWDNGTSLWKNQTPTEAGLDALYVNIIGDTMTGALHIDNTLFVDGVADVVQAVFEANASQNVDIVRNQLADTTVVSGFDERGILFSDGGIDVNSVYIGNDSGNIAHTNALNNVGIGYKTLRLITTGDSNIAIGYTALWKATTGESNIALGTNSLQEVTSGKNNVAIGTNAGSDISDGVNNTAIGAAASLRNISGSGNITIGFNAGRNQTGSNILILDNLNRADIATEVTNAILYGVMAATPAAQTLRINAALTASEGMTIGVGTAATDYTLTFDGETNDGIITWMEDEDYFKMSDEILMDAAEKIHLRDTAIGVYSQADTYLDLFADGAVRIGDSSAGAPTNYTSIDSAGDVVFVGTAGIQFAQIYEEDGTDTLALAAQDTQYQVVSFTANGESNGATPDHTNDHITVAVDGRYKVDFSVSFSQSTAVSIEYDFHIKVNNGATDVPQTSAHRNSGGSSAVGNCGSTGVIDLSASDTVELWVARLDGAAVSRTITFRALSMVLTQVGGT